MYILKKKYSVSQLGLFMSILRILKFLNFYKHLFIYKRASRISSSNFLERVCRIFWIEQTVDATVWRIGMRFIYHKVALF